MSVKIIDTLKPKNNGTFPIVEAVDVAVTSELRLPEALEAKADASALTETNAIVSTKANAADVATTTASLQEQINQIEISATAEAIVAPEVAAARVDAEGTSHVSLKARIDDTESKVNDVRTDILPFFDIISTPTVLTLIFEGNGYWGVNSNNIAYVISREYADAYSCLVDSLTATYVVKTRNFFGVVDYYVVDNSMNVLITGSVGTDGQYAEYTLTDLPSNAYKILISTKGAGTATCTKVVTTQTVKQFAEESEVAPLFETKDIDVDLLVDTLDAYWDISAGKAVVHSGASGYSCLYADVIAGEQYSLSFKYHIYTKPWIVVDNNNNVLLQSQVTTSGIYNETINMPAGAYKLYVTQHRGSYDPTLKLNNQKKYKYETIVEKTITVKKDGSGDFTTIRAAVDSISNASSKRNPYVIEVYEGTYNVFDDYSDEEILSAGTSHYTDSSFVGIKLTDGISMRGVGTKEKIIIHGEVSTTYDEALRNNLSTLNLQGTSTIENITVTAKNIRYAVHDDFTGESTYRTVKNCNFNGENLTSGTDRRSYGLGQRTNGHAYFENCDFGVSFLWHSANAASATHPSDVTLNNCKAIYCLLFNYNHSVINQVHLNNCEFDEISVGFTNGTSSDFKLHLDGTRTNAMISCPAGFLYEINNVTKFPKTSSDTMDKGQLVKVYGAMYWSGGSVEATANKNIAYGVVIGETEKYYYVQKGGYINSNTLELSDLSVGDYVTVDSNGVIETGGTAENAVGVVTREKTGVAFIKLLI